MRYRTGDAEQREIEIAVNGAPADIVRLGAARDTPAPIAAFLDALLDLSWWAAERRLAARVGAVPAQPPDYCRQDAREARVTPTFQTDQKQFPWSVR